MCIFWLMPGSPVLEDVYPKIATAERFDDGVHDTGIVVESDDIGQVAVAVTIEHEVLDGTTKHLTAMGVELVGFIEKLAQHFGDTSGHVDIDAWPCGGHVVDVGDVRQNAEAQPR